MELRLLKHFDAPSPPIEIQHDVTETEEIEIEDLINLNWLNLNTDCE